MGFDINAFLSQFPLGQLLIDQNLSRLGPELLLLVCLVFCITTSLSKSMKEQRESWSITFMGLIFALLLLLFEYVLYVKSPDVWLSKSNVLYGMFQADLFSLLVRMLLVLGTCIVMLFSRKFVEEKTQVPGEFYILLLGALLGGMFMVGANDLIMLFVGLETLGISSYLLAGYIRGDAKSIEASLKYLLYGGASTAILLFGFSLLYGFARSTNYQEIVSALNSLSTISELGPLVPVMCVLVLGGFAFKLSAAPFHMWTPDVYEGAPTPVTAFLSVVSKTAGFAVTVRLLYCVLAPLEAWFYALTIISVVSMIVGNVVALTQTNIKRLLAYSTIAHAGYILLGLVMMQLDGIASMFYYLLTYLFMNLGAFACVIYFSNLTGSDEIKAYSGLVQKKPLLTISFTFFLLSLAGMPITAGFFAKFFLFQSVAQAGSQHLWLVIIALLTSTISLFYYLNVMRLMIICEPSSEVSAINAKAEAERTTFGMGLAITISLVATFILGVYATPFMQLSKDSVALMQAMYAGNPGTDEMSSLHPQQQSQSPVKLLVTKK